jgi:myo-inositol-1(or 4)-monophosphatase
MMSPWIEICRDAVVEIKAVLAAMPTIAERSQALGRGEGGDITSAIDAAVERVIVSRLEGEDVRIVSEELGVQGDGRWRVVVDPIDGSQNAERGIPYFALSVAVADGDTIDDVVFGFVHDFGPDEEWTAVRGGGAFLNGEPLDSVPGDTIDFLSIEATKASLVAEKLPALAPLTDRVRIMGAQAITFCHLAAGRTDAVACLKPSRSVDLAAAQLVARERGFSFGLVDGGTIGEHPLDLVGHSRVVAAGTPELCEQLARALR